MQLARVIGTIVATQKVPGLEGLTILMIQPLNDQLQPAGAPIAAMDSVQSGSGELVYWVAASESSLALPDPFVPVDAAVTGIVDDVNVENVSIHDINEIFE